MSIMYLADARVDYVSSMHGDRFVIDNPGLRLHVDVVRVFQYKGDRMELTVKEKVYEIIARKLKKQVWILRMK